MRSALAAYDLQATASLCAIMRAYKYDFRITIHDMQAHKHSDTV